VNPAGVTIPPAWSSHTFLAEMVDEPLAIHETGEAIVVEQDSRRGMAFIGAGKPAAIAELLSGLDPRRFARGSMIRGTWELLSVDVRASFSFADSEDWDWMDADFVPEVPGSNRVRELDRVSERALIDSVRERAIPDSYLSVDTPGSRWFGWVDTSGEVRAIGGATGWDGERWKSAAHFGSIGTAPAFQGQGIGSALTAGMAQIAFREGATRVSLGVYAQNHRAIEIYRRLGFRTTYEINSRSRA